MWRILMDGRPDDQPTGWRQDGESWRCGRIVLIVAFAPVSKAILLFSLPPLVGRCGVRQPPLATRAGGLDPARYLARWQSGAASATPYDLIASTGETPLCHTSAHAGLVGANRYTPSSTKSTLLLPSSFTFQVFKRRRKTLAVPPCIGRGAGWPTRLPDKRGAILSDMLWAIG